MSTFGLPSDNGIARLADLPPARLATLARRDPSLYAQVHQILGYQAEERERTKYEDSLIEFMKRAWREIDPAPLDVNWHHEIIADHLEEITWSHMRPKSQRLRNLVINVPPRPVSVDALVLTRTGSRRLGDIQIGDEVFSHACQWRRVTDVHGQGMQPCMRLRTKSGRVLELSTDHPVLTPGGWLDARMLTPGTQVMTLADDESRELTVDELSANDVIGDRECRCLCVEGDESFFANGIAVHNCTKSLLVNVIWCAWTWAQPPSRKGPLCGPQVSFLCVSYGATLAEEIALKMRRLVMGDWYQSLWGDRVKIMEDQQSRANFANSAGGERISASVEGGILGRGGDIQILDDVISPGEANSQIERERVLRAISEGLATRVKNPQTAARVMIMQRLHMCLLPGTLVRCPEGERPIESLAVGDLVLGSAGWQRVVETGRRAYSGSTIAVRLFGHPTVCRTTPGTNHR